MTYDVYTPQATTSVSRILTNAAAKYTQAEGVVIDLRGSGLKMADFGNALAKVHSILKSWGVSPEEISDVKFLGGN